MPSVRRVGFATVATLLVGGVAIAAGRGERMQPPEYVAELLADLSTAADRLEPFTAFSKLS